MDSSPRSIAPHPSDHHSHTNPTQPHLIEWQDPTFDQALFNMRRERDKTPRWRAFKVSPRLTLKEKTVAALFVARDLSKAEACRALLGRVSAGETLDIVDALIAAGELEVAK